MIANEQWSLHKTLSSLKKKYIIFNKHVRKKKDISGYKTVCTTIYRLIKKICMQAYKSAYYKSNANA